MDGEAIAHGGPGPSPGPVVVTGATGFVGRAVTRRLAAAGVTVRPAGRHEVGEIHRGTDWRPVLDGARAVVHLAARVHVMRESEADPDAAFREVNLYGTTGLVQQAVEAGVGRFVFMSSIKVCGDRGAALAPAVPPAPAGAYAVSKAEAEAAVRDLSGAMESVILRPPLVYGPGVGGNFARLMALVARGWPLPLGAIDNARSLIFVENLADAVHHALSCRPGIYHPRDAEDLSTPELIRRLAGAMGRSARLVNVPPGLLRAAGALTGRSAEIDRLVGTLTVDGAFDGWVPPVAGPDALAETVRGAGVHDR